MGYNSPVYDKEKATNAKSTTQLQDELKQFEDGLENLSGEYRKTACSFYTNHIAYLRMKISERIGKKGK